MDDIGVLVRNYGINPKGKSAPMAASKNAPKPHENSDSVNQDPNFFSKSFSPSNSGDGSYFDDQSDDIFWFKSGNKGESYVTRDVFDDVFQMATRNSGLSNGSGEGGGFDFDVESGLKVSMNSSANSKSLDGNGDDIWGYSEKSVSSNVDGSNVDGGNGDLLSSDPVDDFWGKMAKLSLEQKGAKRLEENKGNGDVLIPGFEVFDNVNNRSQNSTKVKTPSVSSLKELEKFASHGINKDVNGHGGEFTAKNTTEPTKTVKHQQCETNIFDVDVSTFGDAAHQETMQMADIMFQTEASDLDFFLVLMLKRVHLYQKNQNMKTCEEPNLFPGTSFGMDKKVSPRDFPDFHSMFEGSSESGVFQEIEGESDERRSLRFARHQRAKQRMEHALAEINQREFNAQQEQQEKHRIADTMEMEMKRWAAGKEGNLRALLSSLQQLLGPEFGWKPVSLTDLITSSQVKIAYKKAALCIHPDKVQQRGANLQQKYVAEKAFDLLKEAWNKFSTEELW